MPSPTQFLENPVVRNGLADHGVSPTGKARLKETKCNFTGLHGTLPEVQIRATGRTPMLRARAFKFGSDAVDSRDNLNAIFLRAYSGEVGH